MLSRSLLLLASLCAVLALNVGKEAMTLQQEPTPEARGAANGPTPPISTTMACIINLTVQYFAVYTAYAIVRTYIQLTGTKLPKTTATLDAAVQTVSYAPMLCVLFVATRMRALEMLGPDGNPQDWARNAMQVCAWTVLAMTLLVLALPAMGVKAETDEDGNLITPSGDTGAMTKVLTAVKYILMLGLYGGFTTVCAGAIMLEPAPGSGSTGAVSAAVACTINLAIQYFAVYLLLTVARTMKDFYPTWDAAKVAAQVCKFAQYTVNFAPMLCVLFIGTRMRARQIDPVDGAPQSWAQDCFYLATYGILAQTLMVFASPLAGGTMERGATEGDVTFKVSNPTMSAVFAGLRYVALFAVYGGVAAVIYALTTLPGGEDVALSTTMRCIVNLIGQFFFVYLVLFALATVKEFGMSVSDLWTQTFETARATVQYCPMLCVLFVATRMRAHQLSERKGAPQAWAQDAMYLSTYALLAQLFMVLLLPVVTGTRPQTDKDGNVTSVGGQAGWLSYTVETVRYGALLGLYGGVTAVCTSVFTIDRAQAMAPGVGYIAGFYAAKGLSFLARK